MEPVDTVQEFLDAFAGEDGRDGHLADAFRLVGEVQGAPVLVFAVEGASARELAARGMDVTFDGIEASGDHVLVWGTWSGDDVDQAIYHVVLEVAGGQIQEARFFDDVDQARWFAGL